MTGWIVLCAVTGLFLTVMYLLGRESVRLLFLDASVDQQCADTDDDITRGA